MSPITEVSCSACGKHIRLGAVQYLKRNYDVTCKFCGHKMTSKLSFRIYFFLIIYVHIVAVVTGLPFVLAFAGGDWLFAAAAVFVFFMLTVPPAMALHSRSLRASPE